MEFMPNGTLEDLLHGNSVIVGWEKRLEIVMQIAKGVMFLHEGIKGDCVIVHRDIKSANVLFDWEWNARLCDFGLAVKMNDDDLDERNRPAGTIGYLDPCYTVPGKLSTKTDVFSFGVLLLEIISGRKAMDFSKSPSSIVDWAIPLIRRHQTSEICDKRIPLPRFMGGVISSTLLLASRCLLSKEENRPSMKEIVVELQNCRTVVEPVTVRLPAWMNLLPYCCWFDLLKGERKSNGLIKKKSPATGFCYDDEMNDGEDGLVDHDISRRKMMLWEILADL